MSAPDRTAELYEASEEFWNGESQIVREGILLAGEYGNEAAARFKVLPFRELSQAAQRVVVRQIGEVLAK